MYERGIFNTQNIFIKYRTYYATYMFQKYGYDKLEGLVYGV